MCYTSAVIQKNTWGVVDYFVVQNVFIADRQEYIY
jgi:hypothetical protein